MKGNEDKGVSICIPCGDNRSCWFILAEVLDCYLEKEGLKKVIQEIPKVVDFPRLQFNGGGDVRAKIIRTGLVVLTSKLSWNLVAVAINMELGIRRFIKMDGMNALKGMVKLEEDE